MNLRLYKATGSVITGVLRLCGIRVRITGAERVPARPTLFAVNHFTRAETVLVPYIIWHFVGRPVRSLATHTLFNGWMGKYLNAVGVLSTRDPRRNRTIIADLMTGRDDWVIYPEGGLVKNKQTMKDGRLHLSHPHREGPPRTGAAVLALKAEQCKRRYLKACRQGAESRRSYYEHTYGVSGPDAVDEQGVVIVPVNITFYPLRPGSNAIRRLARMLVRDMDPRMDEELQVEGRLITAGCEISVHFGEPLEVSDFLDAPTKVARRVVGMFSETKRTDVGLRRQATRLTTRCMELIYGRTEINLDHLFCYGLRALPTDRIAVDDFHRALFLAAARLREREDVRLHPDLHNGISTLVTGAEYPPLSSVRDMALRQGVIHRENGSYVVDRDALERTDDFHGVRLRCTAHVLANELEPVRPATEAITAAMGLEPEALQAASSRALRDMDRDKHAFMWQRYHHPDVSRDRELGEPFLLAAPGASVGVVLSHGYLSTPQQVRPLAEALHAAGLSVYAPRLPGHGTNPQHLVDIRWSDWTHALAEAHAVLRGHCRRVIVGGFSLGGALALHLAADASCPVEAVFAINAPMKLRDRRAPFVPALLAGSHVLRRVGLMADHYRLLNQRTESPDLNYLVDYVHGVRQLQLAAKVSRRGLDRITAPTLVLQSDGDPLVHPGSARLIERGLNGVPCEVTHIASARHEIVRGPDSAIVHARILQFIRERVEPWEDVPPARRPEATDVVPGGTGEARARERGVSGANARPGGSPSPAHRSTWDPGLRGLLREDVALQRLLSRQQRIGR